MGTVLERMLDDRLCGIAGRELKRGFCGCVQKCTLVSQPCVLKLVSLPKVEEPLRSLGMLCNRCKVYGVLMRFKVLLCLPDT